LIIPGLINGTNLEKLCWGGGGGGGDIKTHFQNKTKITYRLIAINVKSFVSQNYLMSKYAQNMVSQNDDTGFLHECKQQAN